MSETEKGTFVHYKSDDMRYEVLGVGTHTETNERYVVYRPLYASDTVTDFWVRPYEMFFGNVEVDGKMVPRFKRIGN